MDSKTVECDQHGTQEATFVCGHVVQNLRDRQPAGFFWSAQSENPRPDAWCKECNERVRAAGGDWNAELERLANVSLICGACYDEVKALNGF